MPKSLVSLRKAALLRQKGRCFYCSLPIWEDDVNAFMKQYGLSERQARALRATAEHLVARQDGGRDTPDNIAAACPRCNFSRHRRRQALSPAKLQERVRSRMSSGRWHPACTLRVFAKLMIPHSQDDDPREPEQNQSVRLPQ